jgi:hypothetical protein
MNDYFFGNDMNAKNLIAAVAVFAAGSSFASEATAWPELENFKSTKSRAEVVAEMKQAQANGTYVAGGVETPELVPALAKTIPADSAKAAVAAAPAEKTRAEVYQELVRARAEGNYVVGGREFEEFRFQGSDTNRYASEDKTGNKVSGQ